MQFLKEVSAELRKVKWSTGKETQKNVAAVIVSSMVVGVFFVIVDLGITNLKILFGW